MYLAELQVRALGRRAGHSSVEHDSVEVGWGHAAKHRQRLSTRAGRTIVIDLPRGSFLKHGDVLFSDENLKITVDRPAEPSLVVDFTQNTAAEHVRAALLLGYRLGNQHAPLDLDERTLRTPLFTGEQTARATLEAIGIVGSVESVQIAPYGWESTSADHREGHSHDRDGTTPHGGAPTRDRRRREPATPAHSHEPGPSPEPGHPHDHPSADTVSDEAALSWIQLHDSAFPSGRYVHSQGLEAWLASDRTIDSDELAELCQSYLTSSIATLEAPAASWAYVHATLDDLARIDEHVNVHKLSKSAHAASTSAGRQLATIARQVFPDTTSDPYLRAVASREAHGHIAVTEAVLAGLLGIPRRLLILGILRSAYSQLLSAAVRLGRASPLWAQRRLKEDHGLIVELAAEVPTYRHGDALPDLSSTAVELEIYAMRHESSTTRLFAT